MITLDLSILNQKGTPMFNSDIFSNRPAAGVVGRIFISTDTKVFYRDTGTTWELVGGSGTGTISGSGTAGTLSKFTSASSIGDSIVTEGTGFITLTGTNSRFVVGGTDDGSSQLQTYYDGNTRWKFVAASNNDTDDADITGYRSRGTNSTPLAIQSGDAITNYSGRGYDGSIFAGGAGFDIFAAENFSTGNNGSYISVETTPIGSATPTYFHRFSANGGFRVGQNSDPDTGYIFQTSGNAKVSGNIDVVGYGTFIAALTAANNASSVATYGQNSLSIAAGFSSNNIGAIYGAIAGVNLQTFAGSATFAQANVASGSLGVNSIDFSSAGSTITMTQAAGIRAMSGNIAQVQYQGTNSGTITHAAIQQNLGFYRPSAATGILTITNAYSHLINALDDYGAGFTFTNRWGIYQAGASDKNYFAANMLLGSSVDTGNRLQVTGSSLFVSSSANTTFDSGAASDARLEFKRNGVRLSLLNWDTGVTGFQMDSSNKFYITGGAVGIGVINPLATLHLGNSGDTNLYIQSGATNESIIRYFVGTNEVVTTRADQNGNFKIETGTGSPTEKFRITGSTGNVLIGTTLDNGEKLQVNGAVRIGATSIIANAGLPAQTGSYLYMASGFSSPIIGKIYVGDGTGWRLNFAKRISSTDTELISIIDNGNVLINATTDNGQKLQLNGSLRIDGQTSATAGGSSGQHLIINCDGTTYKIALLNN